MSSRRSAELQRSISRSMKSVLASHLNQLHLLLLQLSSYYPVLSSSSCDETISPDLQEYERFWWFWMVLVLDGKHNLTRWDSQRVWIRQFFSKRRFISGSDGSGSGLFQVLMVLVLVYFRFWWVSHSSWRNQLKLILLLKSEHDQSMLMIKSQMFGKLSVFWDTHLTSLTSLTSVTSLTSLTRLTSLTSLTSLTHLPSLTSLTRLTRLTGSQFKYSLI